MLQRDRRGRRAGLLVVGPGGPHRQRTAARAGLVWLGIAAVAAPA